MSQRCFSTLRFSARQRIVPFGVPIKCSSVVLSRPSQMPLSHDDSNLLPMCAQTWSHAPIRFLEGCISGLGPATHTLILLFGRLVALDIHSAITIVRHATRPATDLDRQVDLSFSFLGALRVHAPAERLGRVRTRGCRR